MSRFTPVLLAVLLGLCAIANAVPLQLSYSGRLTDAGSAPLIGPVNLEVTFWTAPTGGSQIPVALTSSSGTALSPANTFSLVPLVNGVFGLKLYLSDADFNTLFPVNATDATSPWIQVRQVNGVGVAVQTFARQQFSVAPYCLKVPIDTSTLSFDSQGKLKVISAGSSVQADVALVLKEQGASPADTTGFGKIFVKTDGKIYYKSPSSGEQALSHGGRVDGVGSLTLSKNTTGLSNFAFGFRALSNNTTGSNNVAVGEDALISNVNGQGNTGVGHQALQSNSGGSFSTGIGAFALGANNASMNTAVGFAALTNNVSQGNNAALGYFALNQNISGANNVAVGSNALSKVTGGSGNVAVGNSAGVNFAGGNDNVFIGRAADASGTVHEGVAIGVGSVVSQNDSIVLGKSTTRVGIGTGAPVTTLDVRGTISATTVSATTLSPSGTITLPATSSASAGLLVQNSNRLLHTFGTANLFLGNGAGNFTLSGGYNTGIGFNSLTSITTGTQNTGLGFRSLQLNTSGTSNVALGFDALAGNATGSYNAAVGHSALQSAQGDANTALGMSALTGTTGHRNVSVGYVSGLGNASGSDNTYVGFNAHPSVGGLSNAAAIGANAIVAQSDTIVLGAPGTKVGIGTSAPNATLDVLGVVQTNSRFSVGGGIDGSGGHFRSHPTVPVLELGSTTAHPVIFITSASERMRIDAAGNVGVRTSAPGYPLHVVGDINTTTGYRLNGSCVLGSCSSDRRFKKDISSVEGALDRVCRVRPVHYRWRVSEFPERKFPEGLTTGVIAQELEEVYPELVSTDEDGFKKVRYGLELQMESLQAIKELREEKDRDLADLRTRIAVLEKEKEDLKALVCLDHPTATICRHAVPLVKP